MLLIKALKPLIHTLQLVGFTTFEITRENSFYMYNITVIVSLLVTLSVIVYRLINTELLKMTHFNSAVSNVNLIQLNLFRFAHLLIVIESLLKQKRQKLFFDQLRHVDQMLLQKYQIEIDYRSLRRHTTIRLIGFALVYLFCLTSIIGYRILVQQHSLTIWQFIGFGYNLIPFMLTSLRYFQIIVFMGLLRTRFGHLNSILEHIDFNGLLVTGIKPKPEIRNAILLVAEYGQKGHRQMRRTALDQLVIVRELYDRLWDLTQLINDCFGWSLLINTANDFISVTSNCYLIFLLTKFGLSETMRILSAICWTVPHVINLLGITYCSYSTIREVRVGWVFF